MEIITDNVLVPCNRGRTMGLPISGELEDLSQNPLLAHAVLTKVASLFNLTPNEATISGLARQQKNAFLYVQVWDRGQAVRTIAFRSEGYAGIVHLDLVCPPRAEDLNDNDLFGYLRDDMVDGFIFPPDFATDRVWFVQGGLIEFHLPITAWKWLGDGSQIFGYSVDGNYTPNNPDR